MAFFFFMAHLSWMSWMILIPPIYHTCCWCFCTAPMKWLMQSAFYYNSIYFPRLTFKPAMSLMAPWVCSSRMSEDWASSPKRCLVREQSKTQRALSSAYRKPSLITSTLHSSDPFAALILIIGKPQRQMAHLEVFLLVGPTLKS